MTLKDITTTPVETQLETFKAPKLKPKAALYPLDLLDAELKDRTVIGEAERTALALWIAHTYIYKRFKHTPKLFLTSLSPGCGKSATLKLIASTACNGKKWEAGTSLATIRDFKRDISVDGTCIIDQMDGLGKTSTDDFKLMNLFCSSTEVGATIGIKQETTTGTKQNTTRTYKTVEIDVGYPMAMAKIGNLPNEALLSRCITIRMRPETPEERESQMAARNSPLDAPLLCAGLQQWLGGLKPTYIQAPKGTPSRVEDMWQAMLNVADYASPQWGQRARAAMAELHDDQSRHIPREVHLLKEVFDKTRNWARKDITGPELTILLGTELDPGQRGRALGAVGVKSRKNDNRRFYLLADVDEAAKRYSVDKVTA